MGKVQVNVSSICQEPVGQPAGGGVGDLPGQLFRGSPMAGPLRPGSSPASQHAAPPSLVSVITLMIHNSYVVLHAVSIDRVTLNPGRPDDDDLSSFIVVCTARRPYDRSIINYSCRLEPAGGRVCCVV